MEEYQTVEVLNPARVRIAAQRNLRCRNTNRYFTGQGWTSEKAEAKRYNDEFEAALACVENNLGDVELVVSIPGSQTEIFTTPVR